MKKLLFLLVLVGLAGCTTVGIEDRQRGIAFTARAPAWPWQDSQRAIERRTLSSRGSNFNASLRGLTESETTSTNNFLESIAAGMTRGAMGR